MKFLSQTDGSPPRAWGGRAARRIKVPVARLTPTCVGRTAATPPTCPGGSAHPHVRGEDSSMHSAKTKANGSPPRAWGGRATPRSVGAPSRLTPTCVGRTVRMRGIRPAPPAHPHVRGEDHQTSARRRLCCGSPPRAWGGRGQVRSRHRVRGLTPTCVGRTPLPPTTPRIGAAHPHVRGEDSLMGRPRSGARGSPPRAWGGRRWLGRSASASRLTPTCVGRTPRTSSRPR